MNAKKITIELFTHTATQPKANSESENISHRSSIDKSITIKKINNKYTNPIHNKANSNMNTTHSNTITSINNNSNFDFNLKKEKDIQINKITLKNNLNSITNKNLIKIQNNTKKIQLYPIYQENNRNTKKASNIIKPNSKKVIEKPIDIKKKKQNIRTLDGNHPNSSDYNNKYGKIFDLLNSNLKEIANLMKKKEDIQSPLLTENNIINPFDLENSTDKIKRVIAKNRNIKENEVNLNESCLFSSFCSDIVENLDDIHRVNDETKNLSYNFSSKSKDILKDTIEKTQCQFTDMKFDSLKKFISPNKILLNIESSVNILFDQTLNQLEVDAKFETIPISVLK